MASRLVGAAALLVLLAVPSPAGAQPLGGQGDCPPPGLGPPSACVARQDATTTTAPASDAPVPHEPGPALWVGVVFGVSGAAGMVLANARVRETQPEERQ